MINLHNHTHNSLLDGLQGPEDLAIFASKHNQGSIAITDHGTMSGAIDFYRACQKHNVRPIIGMETYLVQNMHTKDKAERAGYHLTLLAKNNIGYQNLIKLSSIAFLDGFYYKPRIDKQVLAKHSRGLVGMSGCLQGEIPQLLLKNAYGAAEGALARYQEIFRGDFYIEIQRHDIPDLKTIESRLIKLGGSKIVATNDAHYTYPKDAEAHDILLCIQTGKLRSDPNRMRMPENSYYLLDNTKAQEIYHDLPLAIENTHVIADKCHVEIDFAPPYHIPAFPTDDAFQKLRRDSWAGAQDRYGEKARSDEIVERFRHELNIIREMGFEDYFLIVADICDWMREQDIWWNVRGSGAGSIVAYALGITHVEPLKNGLMFERFLNPARVNMPDIDLDVPDTERNRVIQYTKEKYGEDRVAAIITFGTLGARAAIRDVGRVLDISYSDVDKVAKLIPNVPSKPTTIDEALASVKELHNLYENVDYVKEMIDFARQVEGAKRHTGTHAAGFLVGDDDLINLVPLNRPKRDDLAVDIQSAYDMDVVDVMGLLKIDFLGLRTLTHMRKTCRLIEKRHGRRYDLFNIPYEEDEALYNLLADGDTTGVFQVSSPGMRSVLRKMQPTEFKHIVAAIALYRPGPIENIPVYISRMQGHEPVEYIHNDLRKFLDDTYGIIVFQEQIMQIAVGMAGYSPSEADKLRKGVAKKKQKIMQHHKKKFKDGVVSNGYNHLVADDLWDDIEYFAQYGFNRAHATDYAVITTQTAFLKAHYPLEFMTALLTTELGNIDKTGFFISDCRRNDIEVLPPCVNESTLEYEIEGDSIRVPLNAIKGISTDAAKGIVDNAPYDSVSDFVERADLSNFTTASMTALIKSGAMNALAPINKLLPVSDQIIGAAKNIHKNHDAGQTFLFGAEIHLPQYGVQIKERQMLDWEKDLLGAYMSGHPVEHIEKEFIKQGALSVSVGQARLSDVGEYLETIGIVVRAKRIITKKGDPMAFLDLEGTDGQINVVIFPDVYEDCKKLLREGNILKVRGRIDEKYRDPTDVSLIAMKVEV